MFDILKSRIIRFVSDPDYVAITPQDLQKALNLPDEVTQHFTHKLNEMIEEETIALNNKNRVSLPDMPKKMTGTFRTTRGKIGFVIPQIKNTGGDLMIPDGKSMDAQSGDIVEARLERKSRRGDRVLYAGKVTRIVERGRTNFTGTLTKIKKQWFIVPDGKFLDSNFIVNDVTVKGGKEDDKVVFEILDYPEDNYPGIAVITEILGKAGLYETEIKATMATYSLPESFSKSCIEQARQAGHTKFVAHEGIEDITAKTILTIDPDDAKDFDDAISIEKDDNGNFVLGVHIADVSRFISAETPLDFEAKSRGNSTYLPGRVVPMLPEILSNGICSLQPEQNRYTLSTYITYNENGKPIASRFAQSMICSSARLTYRQADQMLKGKKLDFPPAIYDLLGDMNTLAKTIEKRRYNEGMLHLDLRETELILDKDGRVVDAQEADTSYPHTIIEMFMVEANEAVARLFDKLNVPFIRRIHPDPDVFSTKRLGDFLQVCGMRLPKSADRVTLRNIIEKVRGTGYEYAVNNAVLRSLSKAVYSPENIGHYALASRHYCHFTSPIRRYADLTIHRLLRLFLEKGKLTKKTSGVISEEELIDIGTHISETEDNSTNAERDLKKVLILEMLSERIGDTMDCVVSGVTRKGVFVQCLKFGIEGFVRSEDLGPDHWQFYEETRCLIGKRSGYRIHIGETMTVKIVKINIALRELDVVPTEPLVDYSDFVKKSHSRQQRDKIKKKLKLKKKKAIRSKAKKKKKKR
ncbi:MAG: ribonuclease R [Sedimentisphaeraceae bacterium JB056]